MQVIKYKKAVNAIKKQYSRVMSATNRKSSQRGKNFDSFNFSAAAVPQPCSEKEAIKLEREICNLIETHTVTNFNRRPTSKGKPTSKGQSRQKPKLPKVEKTIKELEDQFYGRQQSRLVIDSALSDCQIEITKQPKKKSQTINNASPKSKKSKQQENFKLPVVKSSFAENLKNLLNNQKSTSVVGTHQFPGQGSISVSRSYRFNEGSEELKVVSSSITASHAR